MINFESKTGRGVSAVVNNQQYLIGNYLLMTESGVDIEKEQKYFTEYGLTSQSHVFIARNNKLIGLIIISDQIKSNSEKPLKHFSR
ncbi:MAG: hypothetical protein MZV63_26175 [Marinilabiliales bacterium]|nr:hypothetical protein [Marinilabiliales bacterium]